MKHNVVWAALAAAALCQRAAQAPRVSMARWWRYGVDPHVHGARALHDHSGLSLFYGGLVRSKNVLSILMQCFTLTCLISIIGSLRVTARVSEGNAFIGGLSKAMFAV